MKSFKDYIKILPAKSYLFLYKKTETNIRVTKDILKINFSTLLVYEGLVFLNKKGNLYIYSLNSNNRFVIPEGLILFYAVKEDGVFIVKNPKGYYNIFIVKDSVLQKDFFLETVSEGDKKLLAFEHSLPVKTLDYGEAVQKGLESIPVADIIRVWDVFDFDREKTKNFFEDLAKPFLISAFILTAVAFTLKQYYGSIYEKKLNELESIKKETKKIRKDLKLIKDLHEKYLFVSSKFKINKIDIVNEIAKYLQKGRVSYINITDNKIVFTIDADDATSVLSNLNKIKNIKDLKLLSSVRIKKGIKRFRFEGILVD